MCHDTSPCLRLPACAGRYLTAALAPCVGQCRGSPPAPLRAAPHQPLLHVSSVRQPSDLYPFFVALGGGRARAADPAPPSPAERGPRLSAEQEVVAAVEAVLARDFLEPLGEQR